jgi:hypothetical protein
MSLEQRYASARDTPSDINEHVEVLYWYAKSCESVLEMGMGGVASWAFLSGLRDNGKDAKKMVSNHVTSCQVAEEVCAVAQNEGVIYSFIAGNNLELVISPVDLTFIDTWHVYGQLKRELAKFSELTNKFIIIHHTQIDAEPGESVRVGMETSLQSKQSGIPEEELVRGLRPAIEEFLAAHPEWSVHVELINNHGLTVLAKQQ